MNVSNQAIAMLDTGLTAVNDPDLDQTKCYRCGTGMFTASELEIQRRNREAGFRIFKNIPVYCESCWSVLGAAKRAERENVEKQERARKVTFAAYYTGSMPDDARNVVFGGRQDIEACNSKAWSFAQHDHGNLWLHGPQGVGKTCLAYCVLNRALSQAHTAGVLRAVDINGCRFEDRAKLLKIGKAAHLLIDDIDKPAWTAIGLEILWSLVDARSRDRWGTVIVTANQGPEHWSKQIAAARPDNSSIGATLFDRLMTNGCTRLEMKGKSWRRA